MLDIMMLRGGYVTRVSPDDILEESPVENVVGMFDTVRVFGLYKHGH